MNPGWTETETMDGFCHTNSAAQTMFASLECHTEITYQSIVAAEEEDEIKRIQFEIQLCADFL